MTAEFTFISAFLVGLAGGVHCVGMCGGISSAFAFAIPKGQTTSPYILCYNLGRIFSYTLAGALTGWLGSIFTASVLSGLMILQALSIILLTLLAFYISGIFKGLIWLERLGAKLFKHIAPLSKRLIPFKTPWHTIIYGLIWGWLPCGLVYSALSWSLASGDAIQGGIFMLCFGLGTLPALIATSLGANMLVGVLQHKNMRYLIASMLFGYALVLTFQLFNSINDLNQ